MRFLAAVILFLLVIGLAGSVQLGGNSSRLLSLGSVSENILNQTNMNITNQTNVSDSTPAQRSTAISIKNPMSTNPAINKYKSVYLPNNIESNSIAYQFTT
ncbi:Uncharacterised protein [uncultured archaeon]|nr:Uncharacterised protein [uncultured archaeon]